MGMFTDLIKADKPKQFARSQATHNKLVAEAEVYGAEPIGGGKNCHYRNYRLPCGHEQEIQVSLMRIGNFRCQTCLRKKLIDEALVYGADPIGTGKNKDYRNYRLPCGHEQQVKTGHMRIGGFRCRVCLDTKLMDEAAVYGSKLIGSGKNATYRNYRLPCGHDQEVQTSSMRLGQFACKFCQDAKLIEEAAGYGAKLIGSGKNKDYRNYQMPCGHEQQIQTGSMRIGNFRCQTCLRKKLIDEALVYRSRLIGKGKDKNYRRYQLLCGHEQEVETSSMRIGQFSCQTCRSAEIIDDAKFWGAEPIGNGKNFQYLNYRMKCGHEQEFRISHMRIGVFRCQTCQDAKLIDEAAVYGSKLIGSGKNATYRNYRLPCGHDQEVTTGGMRIGQFRCQTCEDTWFTKPSNVYVHIICLQGETFVKVGRAQNVENRINGYGLPSEAVVQTVLEAPTKTGKDANGIETKILQKFKRFRAKNIGHIMTKSGSTECFDASKLSEILDFTKAIAGVK